MAQIGSGDSGSTEGVSAIWCDAGFYFACTFLDCSLKQSNSSIADAGGSKVYLVVERVCPTFDTNSAASAVASSAHKNDDDENKIRKKLGSGIIKSKWISQNILLEWWHLIRIYAQSVKVSQSEFLIISGLRLV